MVQFSKEAHFHKVTLKMKILAFSGFFFRTTYSQIFEMDSQIHEMKAKISTFFLKKNGDT